jgi:hypothetical protein
MIALLLRKYWLEALTGLLIVAALWKVYDSIGDWQERTAKAAADAARVVELEGLIAQRDLALDGWRKHQEAWDAEQLAAITLAAQQDTELAAARRVAETNRRKYREALERLDEADRACAARRVPAAVDSLLGR